MNRYLYYDKTHRVFLTMYGFNAPKLPGSYYTVEQWKDILKWNKINIDDIIFISADKQTMLEENLYCAMLKEGCEFEG